MTDGIQDSHDSQGSEDSSEMELVLEIACNVADTLEQAVELGEEDLLRVALLTLERVQIEESVEISLLVTDDEGLRELNRDFRGRDETTDVLSFPLLDTPLVEAPADELWQPGEDGATASDASGQSAWPVGDDQGAAGLTDSDDSEDEDAADEDADGSDDSEYSDEDDEDAPLHLGDIAISRDAVVRQAAAAGHSVAWECAYLFAHGILHLVGYDDSTDAGYRAMVAHQEAVLAEAHIAR